MAGKYVTLKELQKKRPVNQRQVRKNAKEIIRISREYQLAELRKTLEIRQVDLADDLGIDQSNISRLETGDLMRTELGTISAYVEALGCKLQINVIKGNEVLQLLGPKTNSRKQ